MESYFRYAAAPAWKRKSATVMQMSRSSLSLTKARPRSGPHRPRAPRPKRVSQQHLKKVVRQGKAVRVGATNNPRRRDGEYSRLGGPYSGSQMLYAPTSNQMFAEDNLLSQRKCRLNAQKLSNAPEKPGFVYVKRKKNARRKANCTRPRSRRGNSALSLSAVAMEMAIASVSRWFQSWY